MSFLKRTEIKNGILLYLFLALYFLLMDGIGLADEPFLKIINILFVLFCVNLTVKSYAKRGVGYLKLFSKGFTTAIVGIVLALVGLFIYFELLLGGVNLENYSTTIIPTSTISQYFLALFAEGLASAVIVVFALLQYWKNYEPAMSKKM